MATINSVRTGDWFNPSTWDSNSVPTSTDDVILNHPVRANSNITVGSIINLTTGGGELIISTNLTITCTGTGIAGNKVLLISPKTINSPLIQNVGNITSSLLLDEYPNAAAAYSLRKLRSTYTGNAIRVRRSSDNTELDIGFVLGDLDTAALTTFCSGTDGFVTTWYDQSGNNRNVTQSTAGNQPQIYDAISGLVTTGGLPSIFFDGVNDYLYRDFLVTIGQPVYFEIVATQPNNFYGFMFDSSDPNRIALLKNANENNAYIFAGVDFITTTNTFFGGNRYLYTLLFNSINSEIYQNSLLRRVGNSGLNGISDLFLGARFTLDTFFADTFMQEFIIYPSNQSSNRNDIEENINAYYDIY